MYSIKQWIPLIVISFLLLVGTIGYYVQGSADNTTPNTCVAFADPQAPNGVGYTGSNLAHGGFCP